MLARDISAAQPLPAVEAVKIGDAAKQVSKEVLAAMKQYDGEEKCYNAARQGQYPQAIAAAREGIAAYPQAALARLCIVNTLVAMKAPPDSIIAVYAGDPEGRSAQHARAHAVRTGVLRQEGPTTMP